MLSEEIDGRLQSFMLPSFEDIGDMYPSKSLFTLEEVFPLGLRK